MYFCCSVQNSTGVRNKYNKVRKPYICPFFICFLVVAALTTALVYVISNKTDQNSSKEPGKLSRGNFISISRLRHQRFDFRLICL